MTIVVMTDDGSLSTHACRVRLDSGGHFRNPARYRAYIYLLGEMFMKIKDGFILRKVPGMNLVMPTGKNVKTFNGSLMLNDTGAFIFEKLQKGSTPEETANALTQEYDVSLDTASTDVRNTINSLIEVGVAEA